MNIYDKVLLEAIDAGTIKVLSHRSKRARAIVAEYDRIPPRGGQSIHGCYIKPSAAKEAAYWRCVDLRIDLGGESGTILMSNCFVFSYAFTVRRENGTRWIVFVTPSHIYAIDVWREEEADFEQWVDEDYQRALDELSEDIEALLKDKE